MENHYKMSDKELEFQLRNGVLYPSLFSHQAHLRLAWIHIRNYGIEAALLSIPEQIRSYVSGIGAAEKYNHTLTIAAVKTVYHFKLRSDATDFREFITEFPRLNHNFRDLISSHYSIGILNTKKAKKEFIAPDLLAYDI
jgi:hypothetical protein